MNTKRSVNSAKKTGTESLAPVPTNGKSASPAQSGQLELDFYSDTAKRLFTEGMLTADEQGGSLERETIRKLVREPIRMLQSMTHLTLAQRRVYWLILHSVKNHQYLYKEGNNASYGSMSFHFHASDIVQGDSNIKTSYIKELVNELQHIKVQWKHDGAKGTTSIVVFPVAHYHGDKRTFIVTLAPQLIPGFLELGNNFSQFQLEAAMKLSSQYAQLLYSHFCYHLHWGVWSVSMEELRQWLGCNEGDKYDEYSNFRIRVLDPAIKQVTQHCQLAVTYKAVRSGRRVDRIDFTIKSKDDPKALKAQQQLYLQDHMSEIATWDMARKIEFAADSLRSYYPSFSLAQRQQILDATNTEKLERFLRSDAYYCAGGVAEGSRQNYVLKSVFNPKEYSTQTPKKS